MSGPNIPAIINSESGNADDVARALAEVGGFDIHDVASGAFETVMRQAIGRDPARILVAGGDGTLCAAAHLIAETHVELAILPAGTLNHFAQHVGIPSDLREAAIVARDGSARPVDAGRLNGRLFLNTSSVGAYEAFVRYRERHERRWGYKIASLIAGWRVVFTTPTYRVTVKLDGATASYRTPLVFVGVGERELRIPALGGRAENGKRGLHLLIVRDRSGARLAALAIAAAARGVDAVARTPALDSLIVDEFTIEGPHRTASIDGELIAVDSPLVYRFVPGALSVVIPPLHQTTA